MSLWRLEVLRLWRTQRWLILLAVFVSLGVLGPLTARYLHPKARESRNVMTRTPRRRVRFGT